MPPVNSVGQSGFDLAKVAIEDEMRRSKIIFSAAVAISAIVGIGEALAADMAPRTYTKAPAIVVDPAYNWSGFYVGANVGADWRKDSWNFVMDPGSNFGAQNATAISGLLTGSNTSAGFIGGGQAGYNWQMPGSKWVVGLEGDLSWVGKTTSSLTAPVPFFGGAFFTGTETNRTNWLATLRGRVGYAFDRSLIYVTGGLAVADVRIASTFSDSLPTPVLPTTATRSGVRAGYAIGAGWEQAIANNWSVKLEYLYVAFDRVGVDYTVTSTVAQTNVLHVSDKFNDNILRVGVNYKFGGPVVAKY